MIFIRSLYWSFMQLWSLHTVTLLLWKLLLRTTQRLQSKPEEVERSTIRKSQAKITNHDPSLFKNRNIVIYLVLFECECCYHILFYNCKLKLHDKLYHFHVFLSFSKKAFISRSVCLNVQIFLVYSKCSKLSNLKKRKLGIIVP